MQEDKIKFFANTRREHFLIGVLVGVVLAIVAYTVPYLVA